MAIEIQSIGNRNFYLNVINLLYNDLRGMHVRFDKKLLSSEDLTTPVIIDPDDKDHQPIAGKTCPIRLEITPIANSSATVTVSGEDPSGAGISDSVTFNGTRSPQTTGKEFSIITRVSSTQPVTVDIANDPELGGRDKSLSDSCIHNIELAPVVIDRILRSVVGSPDEVISPSVYLSVDSSQSANDLVGELQAFIELLNVRVELYLGEINNNFNMTQRAADLIHDMSIVLDPTKFIGGSIVNPNVDADRMPTAHYDATEFNSWKNASLQLDDNGQYAPLTVQEWLASKPSIKDTSPTEAKIMNAGISQWAFDERTRGTGHEILVFIFSVELHHYVTGATIMTTD